MRDREFEPDTLDDIINNCLCLGGLSTVKDRIRDEIKKFIGRKFADAMLSAPNKAEVKVLEDLFWLITRRPIESGDYHREPRDELRR